MTKYRKDFGWTDPVEFWNAGFISLTTVEYPSRLRSERDDYEYVGQMIKMQKTDVLIYTDGKKKCSIRKQNSHHKQNMLVSLQ